MNPKINEVMEKLNNIVFQSNESRHIEHVDMGYDTFMHFIEKSFESVYQEAYEAGKADYKLEHERVQTAIRESNQDQRELMNKVRTKDLDQALKGDKKKIAEIITWAKHEIEEYIELIKLLEKKLL